MNQKNHALCNSTTDAIWETVIWVLLISSSCFSFPTLTVMPDKMYMTFYVMSSGIIWQSKLATKPKENEKYAQNPSLLFATQVSRYRIWNLKIHLQTTEGNQTNQNWNCRAIYDNILKTIEQVFNIITRCKRKAHQCQYWLHW